jgi:hypothetical protein
LCLFLLGDSALTFISGFRLQLGAALLSLQEAQDSTSLNNTSYLNRHNVHRCEETYHEGKPLVPYLRAGRILTSQQEYGECMADTPAGMKINFDEQNMTKWEVLMDGPDQSIYAVCVGLSY